uniref:Secreted protein n=1 Tax=Haematobia irritans TaxID=7368 RepID=A0A1L8EB15_HAEIR
MYGKLIFTVILVAFVALPLVNSLKCHTCRSVEECQKPASVQCDQSQANNTRDALFTIYSQVDIKNTTDYTCYVGVYTYGNKTVADIRGCINPGTVNCTTPLINGTWTRHTCNVCSKDLCNTKNSVGTYSSSIFTMIILIFVAKIISC